MKVSLDRPDDETFECLLIVRPEGRLYFVNVQYVAEQIDALVTQHKPHVVVLDMSRVLDIEYSALQMLMEGEKRATECGAVRWLVGLNTDVLEIIRRAGLDKRLGREHMLFKHARRSDATRRCRQRRVQTGPVVQHYPDAYRKGTVSQWV